MARRQRFRSDFSLATRRTRISHAAAALLAALPFAVHGQALNLEQLREADDDRADLTYQNLTVDQIEDMNVFRENTLVGEIEEVLIDDQDKIVAVVVDIESRARGQADREVVMPIEALELDAASRRAATTLTAAEIEALPVWDDD